MIVQEVFVDGSYRNGIGTYGVYFGENSPFNCKGHVKDEKLVLRSEMEAIRQGVYAIESIKRQNVEENSYYTICSDSQSAVDAINGDLSFHINSDIVNDTKNKINSLKEVGTYIRLSYVPGYRNHRGNVEAYKLAIEARN